MKKLLVLGGIAVAAASHAVIMIDDFTTPYFNSITNGTWVDFQGGTMLSGERDVEMAVLANPTGQFLDVGITGGLVAIVSNGFLVESTVRFQYDVIGDEVGNTGANKVLTNAGSGVPLLPGFNDRVRVNFLGNDLDVLVFVEARLNGALIGGGAAVRAGGSGVGAFDIAVAPAVLGAADSITVGFHPRPSGDFALESITAVPEPASLAVIGIGLVSIMARRRRSK